MAWLSKGAQPTETVEKLLKISGAWDEFKGTAPARRRRRPPRPGFVSDQDVDHDDDVEDEVDGNTIDDDQFDDDDDDDVDGNTIDDDPNSIPAGHARSVLDYLVQAGRGRSRRRRDRGRARVGGAPR